MQLLSVFTTWLTLAFLAAAGAAAQEGAPDPGSFSLSLGGGGLVAPDYPGSDHYRFQPLPALDASYADVVFLSVQDGLGANVVNTGGLKAGPLAVFQPGRHQSDNSSVLRGLGTVGDSIALGGFASYMLGDWTAKITTVQDVTNGNDGFVLNGTVSYGTFVPPVVLAVTPGLTVVDSSYNRSFFGISQEQSRRSGLPQHEAGGGLQSADLALTAIYPVTDRISLVALTAYSRLLGDAADSPLVRDEGSPNQFVAGLFFSCKIY